MKASPGLKGAPAPVLVEAQRMTGADLREWMAANAYTAERLARTLAVTERTVFRWRGNVPPPFLSLALLALEGVMVAVEAPERGAA